MNRQETINSIRESLKQLFSATEDKKFSDFVLTDGSKITTTASDLTIGVEVYAVDDMGNQTPLDNGDYVLNDGRTITIVDNKVTNISGETSTEAESPVSDANVSNEAMSDGLAENPSDEGDLAQRVTDLEAQLEEVLNLIKGLSDVQTKTSEQMMSAIKKVAEEPGDEAIKSVKKGYDEYSTKKINAKRNMSEIEELRQIIAEKNKRDNGLSI